MTIYPDILFVNGKIHTQAAELGVVSALAIRGSEIVAAGDAVELKALAGPATDVLDLGGRLVLPGLTDAHCHFQNYALAGRQLNVRLPNKQAALDAVAARVAILTPGEWVLGHGWNQMAWGGEFPSAADLDAVAPNNPVHLTAQSMHMSWVNSAALQLAQFIRHRVKCALHFVTQCIHDWVTGLGRGVWMKRWLETHRVRKAARDALSARLAAHPARLIQLAFAFHDTS